MEVRADHSCQVVLDASGVQSTRCTKNDPQSIHRVAQEFESLLISQLLKSMKQGALSEQDGGANDSVMQYAQESMARVLSQNGGLGIANVVERALSPKRTASSNSATLSSSSAKFPAK